MDTLEDIFSASAKEARKAVLGMVHRAGTSHIASNFSVIDIAAVLYEQLGAEDKVVWSKGWAAATIYHFLAKQGKIAEADLQTFPNAPYLGLAEPSVPGVEVAGGSMGHGLPVAVGMALAKKRAGEAGNVYCIMSDGEMNEGTTWESAMLAGHHGLDNLLVFIDCNKWQAMGRTRDVLDLEPLDVLWRAFKWRAGRVDGHDVMQIYRAFARRSDRPSVIICDTIKGKGVKMFEDSLLYHYKNVDEPTYKKALKELSK